jgi:hypothetical protein
MTSKKLRELLRSHVLGLVAIFIALTGTAVAAQQSSISDGPKASASVVTDAKFKKLKRRVAALEAKPDQVGQIPASLPPSGPAGGDLTGTYPNPQIGPAAVGSAEIADGSILASKLATDSVGARALVGVTVVTSAGAAVAEGTSQQQTATCPAGQMLVGGGPNWQNNTNGTAIIISAPSAGSPNTTWVVEGRVDTGGTANTIRAQASCLAP